ncbi:MAG TPA: MauE/DoxX family redox-associated membrane protein [Magnetospirillaceae bacterium]|nr:MauE/DoxX family redox-associated membrane protein [Magnetospirillaceae bacterium]
MAEFSFAIRALVGLIFLAAAWGKLRHRLEFQGVVANYKLLPDALVAPFALILPPLEAVVGALLPTGFFSPWAELTAAGLLAVFAAAMALNIRRGRTDIDCGCFQSALKQTLGWTLVARNAVLVLAVGLAAVPFDAIPPWGRAEGLMAGAVMFVLVQSLNVLWSVRPAWIKAPAHDHGGAGK